MATVHEPIDFYFDFLSSYGYFASLRIEALAARHGRSVRWHSMLLGVSVMKTMGLKPLLETPLKSDYVLRDTARYMRRHGLQLRRKLTDPFMDPRAAARGFYWVRRHRPGQEAAFAQVAFDRYWREGHDLGAPAQVAALAPAIGVEPAALLDGHRERRGAHRPARRRRGVAGARRVRLAVLLRRRRAVLGQRPARAARRMAELGRLVKEHRLSTRALPLDGITVIDITRVVAGPYCAQMLADLGATVIKVEHPSDPDYVRSFPPRLHDAEGRDAGSGYFAQYNRHKLGVSLDLKHPEGKLLLRELVAKADVLIENFRPGTMDKLGLGWPVLKRSTRGLIYTCISGYGHEGPHSLRPAYDSTAQAAGGLWSMNGEQRPAAAARGQHHRRPRGVVLRHHRHAGSTARRGAQRPRAAGGHLAAGLGGHAHRKRRRQLHRRRQGRRAARQRPSVRATLRAVRLQGRPCLLRQLHRQALARELRDLRRARAGRRPRDRHHGQALRRSRPTSAASSRPSNAGSPTAPRPNSRRWRATASR